MALWAAPEFCQGMCVKVGQRPHLSPAAAAAAAAAEAEVMLCLGQQPCTQHSAMHPGGTKSSLSISSLASCWKVTSPWLNGHIHLLRAYILLIIFPTSQHLLSRWLSKQTNRQAVHELVGSHGFSLISVRLNWFELQVWSDGTWNGTASLRGSMFLMYGEICHVH